VVGTHETFAVNAMVRTSGVVNDKPQIAVSQDGQVASGFGLGIRTGASCPAEAGGSCWAFWVNSSDSTNPSPKISASSLPVVPDQWMSLTGVYNATTGTVQLWVCAPVGFAPPGPAPATAVPAPITATGVFRVGRGLSGGVSNDMWLGDVNSVRAYTHVPSIVDEMTRDCRSTGA